MKKLCLALLMLLCITQQAYSVGESRYSVTFINSSTGLPDTGLDVDLYYTGAAKAYDLTESGTVPGLYYHNTVAHGAYDIYKGGVLLQSNIWIGSAFISTVVNTFNTSGLATSATLADSVVTPQKLSTSAIALISGAVPYASLYETQLANTAADSLTSDQVRMQITLQDTVIAGTAFWVGRNFDRDFTIKEVYGACNGGSVTIQMQIRDESTPFTAGTDTLASNMTLTSTASSLTTAGSFAGGSFISVSTGDNVYVTIETIASGTPTEVIIGVYGTED